MMITWIFLLCVTVTQVTSNPLLQALAQTCPICQQNAMKNPLAAALPMLLQQQPQLQRVLQEMLPENILQGMLPENSWPAPVAQPNMLPCPMCQPQMPMCQPQMPVCQPQNPMCQQNQFCPCPNCCPPPQKSPCPSKSTKNNKKEQVNQALLDKLLSNPAVKSILDPNTKLFTQNGGEVPKNGPCKNGAPSVINNYIIVPPEVLEEDVKCLPKEEKRPKERRGKMRRRRPKQDGVIKEERRNKAAEVIIDLKPPKHNQDTKQVEVNTTNEGTVRKKETQTNKNGNDTEHPRQRKRRRRKKNRQPNIKVKVVDENATEPGTLTILTKNNEKAGEDQSLTTTTEANDLGTVTTKTPEDLDSINETQDTVTESTTEKLGSSLNVHEDITESILPTETTTMKANIETTTEKVNPTSEVEIQIQSPQEVTTEAPVIRNENINSDKNQANKHLNSREESVIADFKNKFSNIPENIVKDLIDHMAQQILKQNLEFPAQYSQYPSETAQLYDNQFHNESPVSFSKKQSNWRTGDNHRNKQINDDQETSTESPQTTVELTEFKHEKTTTPITTTSEKPTKIEITSKYSVTEVTTPQPEIMTVRAESVRETIPARTLKASEPIKSEEDIYATCDDKDDNNYKPRDIYTLYNHGHNRVPELGAEDVVPIFYVNGLDEYYPDFTGDNQYFSDEDFSYLRPEEDRYYYTTDKNYALEELNRERRTHGHNIDNTAKNAENKIVFKVRPRSRERTKHMRRRRPVAKAVITTIKPKKPKSTTETPKVIVTIEQTTEKAKNIEEIQFKTPPTLEKIDFETKPVNKNFYYHDDDHKISTYSDFKTQQYMNDDKSFNINSKPEEKIETVFARSKVVKYGQPKPSEKFGKTDEASLFSTEDKTIVMAKSVSGEFW